MKYDVHLYIACRVRFEDIEANSQAEAVKLAEEQFDPQNFFPDYHQADSREVPVWDESPALGALVDEHEDSEYSKTEYHELAASNYSAVGSGWPNPNTEKRANNTGINAALVQS